MNMIIKFMMRFLIFDLSIPRRRTPPSCCASRRCRTTSDCSSRGPSRGFCFLRRIVCLSQIVIARQEMTLLISRALSALWHVRRAWTEETISCQAMSTLKSQHFLCYSFFWPTSDKARWRDDNIFHVVNHALIQESQNSSTELWPERHAIWGQHL